MMWGGLSGAYLLIVLFILILFHIYLFTRKTFTVAQKLFISNLPLFLGMLFFFNIDQFGSSLIKLSDSWKIEKSRQFVHFDTYYKLDTFENKQRISVPFVLDKEMGINIFMRSYDVGLENVTISAERSTVLNCPMNSIFTSIESEDGSQHTRDVFYGDGDILPPGKYRAIKDIFLNVSDDTIGSCDEKITIALLYDGIKIYSSDLYSKDSGLRELVTEIHKID